MTCYKYMTNMHALLKKMTKPRCEYVKPRFEWVKAY